MSYYEEHKARQEASDRFEAWMERNLTADQIDVIRDRMEIERAEAYSDGQDAESRAHSGS